MVCKLFSFIVFLLFLSCKKEVIPVHKSEKIKDLNVNVLKVEKDGNLKLKIENLSNNMYVMIYSYEGDLDKREHPLVEKNTKNIIISYYPFISKIVEDYYGGSEQEYPIVGSGDIINILYIGPKKTENVNFKINKEYLGYKNRYLNLYFSIEKIEDLFNDGIIGLPPIKEFMHRYNFQKYELEF